MDLVFYLRDGSGYQRVYECEAGTGQLNIRWRKGSCERLVLTRVEPLPESVVSDSDGYVRMRLLRVDVHEGEYIVWRGYLVRVRRERGMYRYEFWGYRMLSPELLSLLVPDGTRADTVFRHVCQVARAAEPYLLRDLVSDNALLADCPILLPYTTFEHATLREIWDWLESQTGYMVLEGNRRDLDYSLAWAYEFRDWGRSGEEPLIVRPVSQNWDVDYSTLANRFLWRGGAPLPANLIRNPELRGEPLLEDVRLLADHEFQDGWSFGNGASWSFSPDVYTGTRAVRLPLNGWLRSPPFYWDDRHPNVLQVDFYAYVPSAGMNVEVALIRDSAVEYRAYSFEPAGGTPAWRHYRVYFPVSRGFVDGTNCRIQFTLLAGTSILVDAITVGAVAVRASSWEVSPYESVIEDDDFQNWFLQDGATLSTDSLRGQYALQLPQNAWAYRYFLRPRTNAAVYLHVRLFVKANSDTSIELRTEQSPDGNNWSPLDTETLPFIGNGQWQFEEVILEANPVPNYALRLVIRNNFMATVWVDAVTALHTIPSSELPELPLLTKDLNRFYGHDLTRLHAYPAFGSYGLSQRLTFDPPLSGTNQFDLIIQHNFWRYLFYHALLEVGGTLYDFELVERTPHWSRLRIALSLNNVSEVRLHLLNMRWDEEFADHRGAVLARVYLAINASHLIPHPYYLYFYLFGERIESREALPLSLSADSYAGWIHLNWLPISRELQSGFRTMRELDAVQARLEQLYAEPDEELELELLYEGDARLLMPHRYLWQIGERLFKVAELEYQDGVLYARLGRVLPTLPELFRNIRR